jgi:hypothetical protein
MYVWLVWLVILFSKCYVCMLVPNWKLCNFKTLLPLIGPWSSFKKQINKQLKEQTAFCLCFSCSLSFVQIYFILNGTMQE